jgi:hypothetical protein
MRLDRVFAYSDRVSFLIPQHWDDSYEEDGNNYLYHSEDGSEGWLRLTLLVVSKKEEFSREMLKELMHSDAEANGQQCFDVGENVVRRWRTYSEREGAPVVVHFLVVARCVAPRQYYQAIFSYTMMSEQLKQERIQQMAEMICNLLSHSDFTYQEQ